MTTTPSESRFTRIAVLIARVLLGLTFFVFGLNGFLNFMPPPPPESLPPKLVAFDSALRATGYFIPLLAGTETAMGALLLLNRLVPLALVILAPVVLNIVLVHVFLAPSGLSVAIIVLALELYLAWAHRRAYAPLFAPRHA